MSEHGPPRPVPTVKPRLLEASTMGEKKCRDAGSARLSYEYLHQLLRLPDELAIVGIDAGEDCRWPGTLTLQVARGEWAKGFTGQAIDILHDYTLDRKPTVERIDDA